MEQIIKEERRSFQQKMDKINHSNELLSNLEKKMQHHFSKRPLTHQESQNHQSNKNHQDSDPHLLTSNLTQFQNQFVRQSSPTHKDNNQKYKYNIFNQLQMQKPGLIRSNNKESFDPQKKPEPKSQEKETKQYRQLKDGTFRLFMKKKKNPEIYQPILQPPFQREGDIDRNFQIQKQNKIKESNIKDVSHKYTNESLEGQRHFEMVEQILKKKIQMKEETILYLQKQLKIQNQERVHLYRINVQLQDEKNSLQQKRQEQQASEIKKLQNILSNLTQELSQRNKENKKLLKQQQLLKEQQKSLLKYRKQYVKNEKHEEVVKKTNKSKSTIEVNQKIHTVNKQEKVYNMVVDELDRLKTKVEQMKNIPKYRQKTSNKN